MKQQGICTAIIGVLLMGGIGTTRADGIPAFVYGKAGTLGLGVGFGAAISDRFSARLGINGGAEYKHDKSYSGVAYGIENKPGTSLEALADWYPLAGSGFRLTTGLIYNNTKTALTGKAGSAGNFNLNDHLYASAATGAVQGSIKYNKVAPYFGVGWESARPQEKGWHFMGDAGILYLGKGRVNLSAAGTGANPALSKDVEEEKRQLESDFKRSLGLAASIGAAYSFQ